MAQLVLEPVDVVALLLDVLADGVELLREVLAGRLALELLLADERLDALPERPHLDEPVGRGRPGVRAGVLALARAHEEHDAGDGRRDGEEPDQGGEEGGEHRVSGKRG